MVRVLVVVRVLGILGIMTVSESVKAVVGLRTGRVVMAGPVDMSAGGSAVLVTLKIAWAIGPVSSARAIRVSCS